MTQSIIITTR